MELSPDKIKENYSIVEEEIERSVRVVGRNFEDVKIVVVTKGQPIGVVRSTIIAGIHRLGENYVGEASKKITAIREGIGTPVEWHMIGHIQSRKARSVCELFDYVHSVDNVKLANRLNQYATDIGRMLPILLECNVSGESSKFGWKAWDEERWDDLLNDFIQIAYLSSLEIKGLMTMAPYLNVIEETRPIFRRLRHLSEYLNVHLPACDWSELSMGMSSDYQIAIQEGATSVRIGTAILGKRS